METRQIHCCGCDAKVDARLTNGGEIYPHRMDLANLPFWKCDTCGNFVGCHHKTNRPTTPLGCIPTKEIKSLRSRIHRVLDPLWKSGGFSRREVYALISEHVGFTYHTASLKTVEECQRVLGFISELQTGSDYE